MYTTQSNHNINSKHPPFVSNHKRDTGITRKSTVRPSSTAGHCRAGVGPLRVQAHGAACRREYRVVPRCHGCRSSGHNYELKDPIARTERLTVTDTSPLDPESTMRKSRWSAGCTPLALHLGHKSTSSHSALKQWYRDPRIGLTCRHGTG
jgi:hypothetical protein